jgi:protein-disulfide isomerase
MYRGWIGKSGLLVLVLSSAGLMAQAPPVLSPATAAAEQANEPQAPTPKAATNPFPAVNPKNFTADTPTVAVVNDFLQAVWGAYENRIWSVSAIQKTAAPGVSRIVVQVADKTQPDKVGSYSFFVTPDGKHAISESVIDFGAKPFAERKKTLIEHAAGPGMGAKGKDLLLVEFGDVLNAKSKAEHETAASLLKEFPQARFVYESLPGEGRPYAFKAAVEGVCVRKAKGDAAFFLYTQILFDKQETITANNADDVFGAAATAAGADAKAVAVCANTDGAKDEVKASVALAAEVYIEFAPALVVNGHILPQTTAGFETLKHIVAFQAGQDGVVVHVQPTLSTLK